MGKIIKLIPPIENFDWGRSVSQLFGVNYQTYYPRYGIPGHSGIDFQWLNSPKKGYGEKVLASHDGKVIRLNYETKWKTNGNGIYLEGDGFQTIYWHLSEIQVRVGQEVKVGDVIGLAGNTGFVIPKPNEHYPYNGTHLHFGLKKRVWNEYKGFVDPLPYLCKLGDRLPPAVCFPRNLYYGKSGDDVSWLQSILKLEGFAKDYEPIGYFGVKTQRDVRRLQNKYGIEPSLGFCGRKTRELIHKRWTRYYN